MRTCLDRQTKIELQVVVSVRVVIACVPIGCPESEHLDAFAIEGDLHLVTEAETFDVFVAVSLKSDLNLVLRILRKSVLNQRSATRAKRETFEVFVLGQVRCDPDGMGVRKWNQAPNRQSTDLFCRRKVPFYQSRR